MSRRRHRRLRLHLLHPLAAGLLQQLPGLLHLLPLRPLQRHQQSNEGSVTHNLRGCMQRTVLGVYAQAQQQPAPGTAAAPGTSLPLRARSCSDTMGRTRAYTAAGEGWFESVDPPTGSACCRPQRPGNATGKMRHSRYPPHMWLVSTPPAPLTAPVQLPHGLEGEEVGEAAKGGQQEDDDAGQAERRHPALAQLQQLQLVHFGHRSANARWWTHRMPDVDLPAKTSRC